MTKFEQPSFSVGYGSKDYVDNWEKTFGKKDTGCKFSEDCKREPEEGNDWCNFHITTEGKKEEVEEKPEVTEEKT